MSTEQAVVRKVLRRLIPFTILCYLLNYIDRTNIALAKLKMTADVAGTGIPGFTEDVFNFGVGIFFIGYLLFELPSNLIQERVGPRRWIARIMITWGMVSACFMFVNNPTLLGWLRSVFGEWVSSKTVFYTLRVLLGVAEAGFFPGVILYLSYWVPQKNLARAAALFLTSTAIAGVIGNPLGSLILYLTDASPLGLHNWQWLFLAEGLPSFLMGLITLFYLTDRPKDARWLSPEERQTLTDIMALQRAAHPAHNKAALLDAFKSPHTWLLSLIYILVVFGFWVVNFFTPTIIKGALTSANVITKTTPPVSADLWVGLFSAIPFGAAAVGMVLIGRRSDRRRERKYHVAFAAGLIMLGLAIAGAGNGFAGSTAAAAVVIAGLSIAAIGGFGIFGPFWALPSQLMTGTAAAAAFAIINSIGNISGFLGPYLRTPLGTQLMIFLAAGAAALAVILTLLAPIPKVPADVLVSAK